MDILSPIAALLEAGACPGVEDEIWLTSLASVAIGAAQASVRASQAHLVVLVEESSNTAFGGVVVANILSRRNTESTDFSKARLTVALI